MLLVETKERSSAAVDAIQPTQLYLYLSLAAVIEYAAFIPHYNIAASENAISIRRRRDHMCAYLYSSEGKPLSRRNSDTIRFVIYEALDEKRYQVYGMDLSIQQN